LTAEENILFFADLYRMGSRERKERLEEVVESLKLKNYLKDITGTLPLGIKQRIALASATIHKPSILFLDEPTSGVDPISRIEFFEYIKNYIKTYNATVVLSTHFLNEAEYCDSIFLFNRGKIILSGRPSKIIKEFEYQILEINSIADIKKAMDNLKDIEGIIEKYIYGKKIRIIITKDYNVDKLATHLNINKENIKVANTSLEDIFIRLTND
jgi:ABC-type multidrug transport system ATPase subunit